jgi:hypothetical protein
MPVPTHLLERAYQLINANQLQNAELVLDAVVRVDPQNVEAWKTYLMIHQSQNDLDWLKERILKTKELGEADKTRLINYHYYLTKQLNGIEEVVGRTNTFALHLQEEKTEKNVAEEIAIQFELIDVFDYPEKMVKNEIRPKPRRRAIYNPFTFNIAGGFRNAMVRNPFGRKIADRIQEIIILANNSVKNPKDTYARFSKSSNFKKYIGFALLALFVLGIRLALSGYFFGYAVLGIFIIGSWRWLSNFGGYSTSQTHVYSHENINSLPVVKEIKKDRNQKSSGENTPKPKL